MNIFYRILFVVIAVCIPAVSILSAFNIVFRMPDLYRYEFNRYEVASQVDLGITDDELGQFFSDFMMEKKDDFDLSPRGGLCLHPICHGIVQRFAVCRLDSSAFHRLRGL
jgi:hypothetical protein